MASAFVGGLPEKWLPQEYDSIVHNTVARIELLASNSEIKPWREGSLGILLTSTVFFISREFALAYPWGSPAPGRVWQASQLTWHSRCVWDGSKGEVGAHLDIDICNSFVFIDGGNIWGNLPWMLHISAFYLSIHMINLSIYLKDPLWMLFKSGNPQLGAKGSLKDIPGRFLFWDKNTIKQPSSLPDQTLPTLWDPAQILSPWCNDSSDWAIPSVPSPHLLSLQLFS